MEGPALTWRLRRYGRTLWSSIHARNKSRWLVIQAESHSARPPDSTQEQARTDERANEPRHWLDTLRGSTVRFAIRATE